MHIVSIGVLLAGSLLAQPVASPAEWQSMKIEQTSNPSYPKHLLQIGVLDGKAQVAIKTDVTGKLVEWLVVGYTQPEFAESAVNALKQWKFEPARLKGEPVGTTVVILFNFAASGAVVSLSSPFDPIEERIVKMKGGGFLYRACPLNELDRIPEPQVIVKPRYSSVLFDQGIKGTVTVEFYIDETGAVRMATVSAMDNLVLCALAIDAVNQWKFTPPTRKGRTVLVKASQVFDFRKRG